MWLSPGLLAALFLSGCAHKLKQELRVCYGLAVQCEKVMDICLAERKASDIRGLACEETGSQLMKCLDEKKGRVK